DRNCKRNPGRNRLARRILTAKENFSIVERKTSQKASKRVRQHEDNPILERQETVVNLRHNTLVLTIWFSSPTICPIVLTIPRSLHGSNDSNTLCETG